MYQETARRSGILLLNMLLKTVISTSNARQNIHKTDIRGKEKRQGWAVKQMGTLASL